MGAMLSTLFGVMMIVLKAWKSKAEVKMMFEEIKGGTEVVWSLESALPFFMLFMKGMMRLRSGVFKQSKQQMPFEIYVNDSAMVEPRDLITEVC